MTSSNIEFVYQDRIFKVKNSDPNEILLNYIRTKLKKTGTKEGCAEGGCGACTVVLGELKNNEINYKAVNSCITLLPTLHGKQLILVEDLISKEGVLHPVQQAMVDYMDLNVVFVHQVLSCHYFRCIKQILNLKILKLKTLYQEIFVVVPVINQ